MKYRNKLQFFFLILASVIFCGQELVHPVFHAHQEASCHHSQYQPGSSEELKTTDRFTQDIFLKSTCPICNSIANKFTKTTAVQAKLISYSSLTYSQTCESFSFNSYIKPVSRGPPAV
jgi:hypothetical protein